MPRPSRVLFLCLLIIIVVFLASYKFGDSEQKFEKLNQYRGKGGQDQEFKASPGRSKDVHNSTLGFQKILVINLPERGDKLDAFSLAASLTGLTTETILGVRGQDVPNNTIPSTADLPIHGASRNSMIGCWRAHLNFARTMINQHLSTALVMEDDSDWDTSLKDQLHLFSQGSQYVTASNRPSTRPHSPYGDDWDLLWIGHCGSQMKGRDERRFVIENDKTVPAPERRVSFSDDIPDTQKEGLDNSTRIIYEANNGLCTYAYALSQRGARKLLRTQSNSKTFLPIDIGMGKMCKEDPNFKCVGVFPTIIDSHKGAGRVSKDSDIMLPKKDAENTYREKGYTLNIVHSTRLNMDHLLLDHTDDIERQYPEDPVVDGPARTRALNR